VLGDHFVPSINWSICYLGDVTKRIHPCLLVAMLVWACAWPFGLHAQGEGDMWFFGDSVLLDFKPALAQQGAMPVSVPKAYQKAQECSSTLCTADGRLLMYTNGWQLFDSNHVNYANWVSNPAWAVIQNTTQGVMLLQVNDSTVFFLGILTVRPASAMPPLPTARSISTATTAKAGSILSNIHPWTASPSSFPLCAMPMARIGGFLRTRQNRMCFSEC
jgi:hypothetical protein